MFGNTGEKNGGEEMSRSEMRRIEKTNRTFAKLVLTAVILFLLIIAAEHGTMTVLAEEPAVYGTKTAVYESVKVGEGEDLEIIADRCERRTVPGSLYRNAPADQWSSRQPYTPRMLDRSSELPLKLI